MKIFATLRRALAWWNDPSKKQLKAENARLHAEWSTAHRANGILIREREQLKAEAQNTRAQLMQLRVENSDPQSLGRIGWQVSAFIPDAVLNKLRAGTAERLEAFTGTVARDLVAGALRGIFKRNSAGHCTALVWEPLSADSKKTVLTGWFEGDPRRPGVIYNSNDDAAIRRITGRAEADAAMKKLLNA